MRLNWNIVEKIACPLPCACFSAWRWPQDRVPLSPARVHNVALGAITSTIAYSCASITSKIQMRLFRMRCLFPQKSPKTRRLPGPRAAWIQRQSRHLHAHPVRG